ncbi:MAG: 2-C-methyl-D-erythritol 4-phosphate cytidylyltransferase [Bacteroidales bacterium]|nr:2-C-methyl-D-erythritol 4-phosphate cytidylyltransferase [Bacteroidales bacterium]
METFLLITAAGQGTRLQASFPKQFIPVAGKPLLMHSIDVFKTFDPKIKIILVLPDDQIQLWKDLCIEFDFLVDHQIVRGGEERFHSVQNGLNHIPDNKLVLIHDGVRPMVRPDTIERVIQTATEKGNAIPCVTPTQTVRQIHDDNSSEIIDRSKLRLVQTPQGFHSTLIKKAYQTPFNPAFTDDASVLEFAGYTINIVEGNYSNIKVTHPADLKMVEALLTVD